MRKLVVSATTGWHQTNMVRSSLVALLLAGAGFAPDRAGAHIIKKDDMLRGVTMTRPQCTAISQALWLSVYGQDFCVRYYLSTAGGEGSRPVVFLNGDSNGPLDITQDRAGNVTARNWHDPSMAHDVDTDALMGMADAFSKTAKTPAIYLGRIGVEGSSGNHMARKTMLELQLMNAALDALKQRYRFEGFHLAGESGGARLVFGLLGMRNDIGCAVSGSGQLANPMPVIKSGDPAQMYFEINAPLVARNHPSRQIVITDPADQQAPAATDQTPMVVKLRGAGAVVDQFFVQSTDPRHHGVPEYIELGLAGCILDKHAPEILRAFSTVIRRNAQSNQLREDEAKYKAALGATARQPPIDPPTAVQPVRSTPNQ
jgi:hypothetical protein